MNIEMAYLLGMITGNGEIQREKDSTRILIEIPHKKLETEFETDVRIYVKASIADIRKIIEPLIGADLTFEQNDSKTFLSFNKKNEDYLIREILRYIDGATSHENIRISEDVFKFTTDERKYFIKGFADVTGYIRDSNKDHGQDGQHRVYFEIPRNWYLVIDFCNLLRSVDIPVQNIDWGHPNMRDGNLKDYDKGKVNVWKREHQVKVWALKYLPIGFGIIHKQEALIKFADEQKEMLKSKKEKSLKNLDKYYWEKTRKKKEKLIHPKENDDFIPEKIRGKHFDSWQEIAEELGYKE